MDYEDVSNFTFGEDVTAERSAANIAHEVIFTIFCVIGVFADGAIIYTILHFKRMRTVPNIFIANWAIADVCSLIVTPSGYRIISLVNRISISPEFICTLEHFGTVFHLTVMIFVILVSIDWFIAAYFTKTSETIRMYHKCAIRIIWILSFLTSGITTGLCMADNESYFAHVILFYCVFLVIMIPIALHALRITLKCCFKKPQYYPTLPLTLTTAFGGCWVLSFLAACVGHLIRSYPPLWETLIMCLLFSSSVINFTLMYCLNKDFQACFRQSLRLSGRGYEEANFDFENPIYRNTVVGNTPAVKSSCDKQNEQV